jgi:hypothetical protein
VRHQELSHQGGIADYLSKWVGDRGKPTLCPPVYVFRDGDGERDSLRAGLFVD